MLRERVSIRDLGTILESMLETAPVNKSPVALVEAARQALGRRLIQPLLDGEGQLPVLLLDGALEEEILATLTPETGQRMLASETAPGTPLVRRLADSLRRLIPASSSAALPVLLCPKSGPLSRQALAGAGPAAAGGGGRRGDSCGDSSAPGGHGALKRRGTRE